MNENDNEKYLTILIDTEDGTGDAFVPLPREVIEKLGLEEGNSVELSVEDGAIIIHRPE